MIWLLRCKAMMLTLSDIMVCHGEDIIDGSRWVVQQVRTRRVRQ